MRNKTEKSSAMNDLNVSNRKYELIFLLLLILLICITLFSFCIGRYSVQVSDVIKILLSKIFPITKTWDIKTESVILVMRMPRIIASLLVGSALALSGATYQGVFKNPLVAPDMLGVSSGACIGASLAILMNLGNGYIQVGAFLGGLIAVSITTTIPKLLKNTSALMLVLSGVIVGGLMTSIMGIIKYLADPETQLAEITYWQMGSLTKVMQKDIISILPTILITTIIVMLLRYRINVISLGENEAKSLGINVGFTRGIIILCSTILTASSVCICGTIGWIGLVIPHLGRMLVGPNNVKLLPITFILGAIFMLLVDTVARVLTSAELPLSILTGIIGAPFYFYLLIKQRTRLS